MKRILLVVAVLALVLLAYSQYKKARRLNAPQNYVYSTSGDIDPNYYDPNMVSAYFESAAWLESWVRSMWYSRGIDVLTMDETNMESLEATVKFNGQLAEVKEMEARLEASNKYKQQGFNNAQIRRMVEEGLSPEEVKAMPANLRVGDAGQAVTEVQQLLVALGFPIPTDGNFRDMTRNAVMEFQRTHQINPTGEVDPSTLAALKAAAGN